MDPKATSLQFQDHKAAEPTQSLQNCFCDVPSAHVDCQRRQEGAGIQAEHEISLQVITPIDIQVPEFWQVPESRGEEAGMYQTARRCSMDGEVRRDHATNYGKRGQTLPLITTSSCSEPNMSESQGSKQSMQLLYSLP